MPNMIKSRNINMDKVHEMSEGDMEFQKELLQAIASSVEELKERYEDGITKRDEDILHQARHKVKPTVTIFELRNLSQVLDKGRQLIQQDELDERMNEHWEEFSKVADDLLREIYEMNN
ncbi:hypothetical protein DN752_23305 [Echinicola strongylocentroti]|uniref:HPt domain-containing protein n=1 Tax=Echinicola strongylocentroti TaxID=1795355 RepID=A0A2Z4IRH8_9BACT|nr:hypothetical protein [Echinicola strongylocentroti]AWW33319.1 hypothetical protein DN752_23305 [Echinicola strongylocentroti]